MAVTPSTMAKLRTAAPDFKLHDVVSGREIRLETFADKKALLVMFLSRHCPFVQHVKEELARLGHGPLHERRRPPPQVRHGRLSRKGRASGLTRRQRLTCWGVLIPAGRARYTGARRRPTVRPSHAR